MVGDIMLDRYVWGSVDRVSPEAPAPILRERRQSIRAGDAGNTVIAGIAAALIGKFDDMQMLHFANLAAGVVVGQIGTVAIDRAALLRVINEEKRASAEILHGIDERLPLVERWCSNNRGVVYVEGLFDGVYANDVHFLQNAAREGDKLVVGITSCESADMSAGISADVAADLSGSRPQSSDEQLERAMVVASPTPVDAVVLCNATNSSELIDNLNPEVVLVGGER